MAPVAMQILLYEFGNIRRAAQSWEDNHTKRQNFWCSMH